jgi:predicted secreted protein
MTARPAFTRRRILKLTALSAAGGASITVALAWLCLLFGVRHTSVRPITNNPPVWPVAVPADWPARPRVHSRHRCFLRVPIIGAVAIGTWYDFQGGPPTTQNSMPELSLSGLATGWPFDALVGWYECDRECSPITRGYIHLPPNRVLSYLPVWPGFDLDTALFGLLTAITVAGIQRTRRNSRAHAGRCVSCDYDLRGLPTCPECGSPADPTRVPSPP